ncbi:MAG: hypothetical protein ACRD72_17950, partial [Candidatus Angelobacter sp.]
MIAPWGMVKAQENAKPASAAAAEGQAKSDQSSPKNEGVQQLENGGEADAIRNAPAVKWIARHT